MSVMFSPTSLDGLHFEGVPDYLSSSCAECAICGSITNKYSLVKAPIRNVIVCNGCIEELNFVHHILCGAPALAPVDFVDTRSSLLPDCDDSPFFEGSAPVWEAI